MGTPKKGRVEYGARAFEQDANSAIRGDVVRALIELITNSDDAYGLADGAISVRVLSTDNPDTPVEIRVHDHATGLPAEGLLDCFTVLGAEKPEGEQENDARGLLGRGAKDVASLGWITFEAIRDELFSRMLLTAAGDWELTDEDVAATELHREQLQLGTGQNGLTATLFVNEKFRVPSRNMLQEKLSQHAQLRELIGRRPVFLQDLRDDPFMVRLEPRAVKGEVVIDADLQLIGYETPVHLVVRRLPKRANGGLNEYSEQGLLVRSGVTVFQNTWFDLGNRPEANYFAGEITAPQIAAIIKAYDRKEDLGGPVRLLSRDRDGLVITHPYRKELARVVAREVQPLFDSLAKQMDAGRKQGEKLSKAFKVAGDALREQVTAVLSEIEDDDKDGGEGTGAVAELALIPPRRVAIPGEALTLTIRALHEPAGLPEATVEKSSGDDVIEAAAADEAQWAAHSRLEGVFVSRVFVKAGLEQGTATIRVSVGDLVAHAEVVVMESETDEEEPPDSLELSPTKASMAPNRGKRLVARAPIEACERSLSISHEGVELAQIPKAVTLRAEPGGRWAEAVIRCKAGANMGKGKITATLEDDQSATADIVVEESAARAGLSIDFELNAYKSPNRRIDLLNDHGNIAVRVYALHPSFNGIFGKYLDPESKFAEEDSAQARAVLAEVVGAELASHLTERDYNLHPERLNDAPRVLVRRAELANRFLVILHRALAPTAL